MTSAVSTSWLSFLVVSSIAVASVWTGRPASAAPPCVNGLSISTIISSSPYECTLGSITYIFDNSLNELNNPNAKINFFTSDLKQEIRFESLSYNGFVSFGYDLITPNDSIESIDQSYTPATPAAINSILDINSVLPADPSDTPYTMYSELQLAPGTTLTSLTHTINKTPAPLPVLGAGMAFTFSRRLRRRIARAS